MEKKKLSRTIQCAKYFWKKSTNPYKIPDGYNVELHKKLERTIAEPGSLEKLKDTSIYAMSCHLAACGEKEFCVGWLYNQLGEGNNIPLRIHMIENYEDWGDLKVVGEQHATFKDTLPHK